MADVLTQEQRDTILKDIVARLESVPKPEDQEAKIKAMVEQAIKTYADSQIPDRNKLIFGGGGAGQFKGSKFARYNYTVADVEFLYDLMAGSRGKSLGGSGGAVHPGPSEELETCFKFVSEAVYLPAEEVKRLDQKALDNLFPRIPKGYYQGADQALVSKGLWWLTDAYQRAVKAMDTAETGFGLQLIGNQYVGELWQAARPATRLFALINTFEMTAPTAFLPIMQAFPEMLFVAESTANNSSNYDTTKTGSNRVQVDAKKFVIHQMWSGEMEEDSIVPFIPFLRMELQNSIAHYSDSLVLNGDTTNTATGNINLDDADPADTKHYLAFDGIRHVGLVDVTGNSKDIAGAISATEFLLARGRMVDNTAGKYFYWGFPDDPMDVVHVMDFETYLRVNDLNEVVTVDKMGPRATILNGQLASIYGHPIIVSAAMSKTEADGKVSTTGSNNTKGQVATFNRRGFVVGWRRRIRIETERLPATDQTRIVASLRLGFGRFGHAASAIEAADCIFNITV